MSVLVITPTYVSLDVLFEADLDSIRVPLQNFLNVTKLDSGNLAPGSLEISALDPAVQAKAVPVGTILEFFGSTLPAGYLWCNGETYTTSAQPDLYNVIATTYGGSPGVNFQVPDKRDRVTAGRDNMGGSAANRITFASSGINGDTIGAAGGAETLSEHTHTEGTLTTTTNSHSHTLNDSGHTHPIYRGRLTGTDTTGFTTDYFTSATGTVLSHTQSATTDTRAPNISYGTTGSTHEHTGGGAGASGSTGVKAEQSVVQPSIVCNFIIKA